jgi:hypothetical protein
MVVHERQLVHGERCMDRKYADQRQSNGHSVLAGDIHIHAHLQRHRRQCA